VERIERIKKEEEERSGNEAEALPNRDRDHSLHRVEAKLHGESKVIQRCFDDNNDNNKR